jgi:hypothetical protein
MRQSLLALLAIIAVAITAGCAPKPISGNFIVSNLRLEETGTGPVEVRAFVRTDTPRLQKALVSVWLRSENSDGGIFETIVLLENGTGELYGVAYTTKPLGENPNAWRTWTVVGYHELAPGSATLKGTPTMRRR